MLRLFDCESKGVISFDAFLMPTGAAFRMPRHKKAFRGLSMSDVEILEAAVIGLEAKRSEIEEKMAELRRQLDDRAGRPGRSGVAVNTAAPPVLKKRTMSAAGRRRVAEAQRKRWAELKKTQAENAAPVK
jgi:hypothetical protein